MFKRKITLGVTAGLLGAFALAGGAFAQEGPVDSNSHDSIKDRVAEILGIDREALDSAMSTAREENREAKQDERLASLVESGTITQAQSDEINTWEDSKPTVMDELMKLGRAHGTGDDASIEARLTSLVDQEVITQAEADKIIAWNAAKPDYLHDLRTEMRPSRGDDGERDGRHGRQHGHRGFHRGELHGRGPGGPGFEQQAPEIDPGTSFTFPNGDEINI
ncbi:MAG: hypothetical protein HQ477_01240 [Chloroflexi bacterium]|nr:hypothetical protein [Chloroflexota bacterium]